MVYISSWQEYQEAAEALYAKSPIKARYCVKWKPSEGKLVLKITDDTTCLKYKTHSSIFLNRFEALNISLMQKMQNRQPPLREANASTSGPAGAQVHGDGAGASRAATPQAGASTATPTSGGPAGGGVKKKKAKKKK